MAHGETARFGGLRATPGRIEEDSRCPASVQCIQAGTVRLSARVEHSGTPREVELTLGAPVRLDGAWLTLAAVCPHPQVPGPIPRRAYRFTFAVGIEAPAPPLDRACAPPAA